MPPGGPLEEAAETAEYRQCLLYPLKFKNSPLEAPRTNPVNIKPGEDRTYYLRHLSNMDDPVTQLTEAETLAAVSAWLEKLPSYEQSILTMHLGLDLDDEQELTYEEIAEHLGVSKSKVERDIKKVLRKGLLEILTAAQK